MHITNRQPSNAGGFRRLAFTRPAKDEGKEKKQQVNPALRLPAERYNQPNMKHYPKKPGTIAKNLVTIISIVLALSGWGTIIYEYIQSKPKIKGEIILGVQSYISINNLDWIVYSPYIFLTNLRGNPAYIKTIYLEYNYNGETIRVEPFYTIQERIIDSIYSKKITNQIDFNIVVNNSIFKKNLEIKYGYPLQGFISFPIKKEHKEHFFNTEYTLIIIDIFEREYKIKNENKSNPLNLDWFKYCTGIKLFNFKSDSAKIRVRNIDFK
jgi:hypothetical protein